MNEISLKPIKTETEYVKPLSEVDEIFDVEEGTPEARLLDELCKLISDYEDKHYPIDPLNDSPCDSP